MGGGGSGGGGGGLEGGDGGSSKNDAGTGGVGCTSQDSAHTLTNFNLSFGSDRQGALAPDRPAGSGRDGKVVITAVLGVPITPVASPAEGGSVTCTPVPVGEATSCTATPTAGWHLTGISGCGGTAGTSSPYTTGAVTAACTVTATFAKDATPGDGTGSKVQAVPSLGEWALMLLGALAAGLGLRGLKRRSL